MIKECKRCGEEFDAKGYRSLFCEKCKEKKKREYYELYYERHKEQQRLMRVAKKKKKSIHSVEKAHREILEYEKKHGKRLTYGQYQVLKRLGKI